MLTFFHHFCIKPFIFLLGFYCQLKKKTFDEIEKISVISGAIYCKINPLLSACEKFARFARASSQIFLATMSSGCYNKTGLDMA